MDEPRITGYTLTVSTLAFAMVMYLMRTPTGPVTDAILPPNALTSNLVFENTSLEKVVDLLQANYNVRIEVGNSEVLSCPYSGTFRYGTPLKDVVMLIARAEGLTVVENQDGILLLGNGCFPETTKKPKES